MTATVESISAAQMALMPVAVPRVPTGRSAAILEVVRLVRQVARHDSNVLVLGESGTGKEVVARAVHDHSQRRGGPFVAVNCGAIPADLLESELFGHEKGAFTGAYAQRPGRFEVAEGGTLFLDEIGDMSLSAQAKVLRVLQDGVVTRIGGSKPIQVDVRVLAATNKHLEDEIANGRFREDLFYRLNVFQVGLPALRERMEDIPLLAEHFLERVNARLGREIKRIHPDALKRLLAHQWPGNVRELEEVARLTHGKTFDARKVRLPTIFREIRAYQ